MNRLLGTVSAGLALALVLTVAPGAANARPTTVQQAETQTVTHFPARPLADTLGATNTVGARNWPGHPRRKVIRYTVRRGDTASGIAVRFHAWTRELLAINNRSRTGYFFAGETIKVPVVVPKKSGRAKKTSNKKASKSQQAKTSKAKRKSPNTTRLTRAPKWVVRDEIKRVARQLGIRPRLALAIAWQESGWQQQVRSHAGAIGTMQVMPANRKWLSMMVGRPLKLRYLHDNVVAGLTLFKLLRKQYGVRKSLAAYYQGIGSIQAHGRYRSTKQYVKNVTLHWKRLNHGWRPLR